MTSGELLDALFLHEPGEHQKAEAAYHCGQAHIRPRSLALQGGLDAGSFAAASKCRGTLGNRFVASFLIFHYRRNGTTKPTSLRFSYVIAVLKGLAIGTVTPRCGLPSSNGLSWQGNRIPIVA